MKYERRQPAPSPHIATIPKRLDIEGRPELEQFPLNVLFGSLTVRQGPVIATAVYEPDLDTYQINDGEEKLTYYNTLSKLWVVTISRKSRRWKGEKFQEDERVLMATGKKWDRFFTDFTENGLSMYEICSFEPISNYR